MRAWAKWQRDRARKALGDWWRDWRMIASLARGRFARRRR